VYLANNVELKGNVNQLYFLTQFIEVYRYLSATGH